jgi:hypothetical protein
MSPEPTTPTLAEQIETALTAAFAEWKSSVSGEWSHSTGARLIYDMRDRIVNLTETECEALREALATARQALQASERLRMEDAWPKRGAAGTPTPREWTTMLADKPDDYQPSDAELIWNMKQHGLDVRVVAAAYAFDHDDESRELFGLTAGDQHWEPTGIKTQPRPETAETCGCPIECPSEYGGDCPSKRAAGTAPVSAPAAEKPSPYDLQGVHAAARNRRPR